MDHMETQLPTQQYYTMDLMETQLPTQQYYTLDLMEIHLTTQQYYTGQDSTLTGFGHTTITLNPSFIFFRMFF